MEEIIRAICNYAVLGLVGVMGWFFKSLQNKVDRTELEKLSNEVYQLREHIFKNLATKEDLNKLEQKIDKLIDRELGIRK